MNTWTKDELDKIGTTEELEIQSLRPDGTLRNPVTIWVVRLGDNLYIRSVNGRDGKWFRDTQERHAGHITCGGVDKDVTFEDAEANVYDQVDAVYREKYHGYSARIVNTDLTKKARLSTLKIMPR